MLQELLQVVIRMLSLKVMIKEDHNLLLNPTADRLPV
jgi:hypothetical protein